MSMCVHVIVCMTMLYSYMHARMHIALEYVYVYTCICVCLPLPSNQTFYRQITNYEMSTGDQPWGTPHVKADHQATNNITYITLFRVRFLAESFLTKQLTEHLLVVNTTKDRWWATSKLYLINMSTNQL